MFGDDFGDDMMDFFRKAIAGDNDVIEYSTSNSGTKRVPFENNNQIFSRNGILSQVVTKDSIYFVFDFSGKEDISAKIKEEKIKDEYGEALSTGKRIIEIYQDSLIIAKYPISDGLKTKNFHSSFSNGLLEVSFKK